MHVIIGLANIKTKILEYGVPVGQECTQGITGVFWICVITSLLSDMVKLPKKHWNVARLPAPKHPYFGDSICME